MKLRIASLLLFFSIAIFAQKEVSLSIDYHLRAHTASESGEYMGLVIAKGNKEPISDEEMKKLYERELAKRGANTKVFIKPSKYKITVFTPYIAGGAPFEDLLPSEFKAKMKKIIAAQKKAQQNYYSDLYAKEASKTGENMGLVIIRSNKLQMSDNDLKKMCRDILIKQGIKAKIFIVPTSKIIPRFIPYVNGEILFKGLDFIDFEAKMKEIVAAQKKAQKEFLAKKKSKN